MNERRRIGPSTVGATPEAGRRQGAVETQLLGLQSGGKLRAGGEGLEGLGSVTRLWIAAGAGGVEPGPLSTSTTKRRIKGPGSEFGSFQNEVVRGVLLLQPVRAGRFGIV